MEGNDKRTEWAVSYKQIGLIIFVFIFGVVSALLLSNAQTGTPTTFTTTELIGFILSVILSGAAIVLAISAITLGKSSEQAVIKRSDESIKLQNEVFTKTTEALQRIESSTGVTEKRIEDIISGRAGDMSHQIAEAIRDSNIPTHDTQKLEEDIRRSIIHSVTLEETDEELEEKNKQRLERAKQREIYLEEHRKMLYAIANKEGVQVDKMGHGDVEKKGDELFDGIFRSKDKRIAISTYPAAARNSMLTNFISRAAQELSEGTVNKVLIVLFERKIEDEIFKALDAHIGTLKDDISSNITHATVEYENISKWVDELEF